MAESIGFSNDLEGQRASGTIPNTLNTCIAGGLVSSTMTGAARGERRQHFIDKPSVLPALVERRDREGDLLSAGVRELVDPVDDLIGRSVHVLTLGRPVNRLRSRRQRVARAARVVGDRARYSVGRWTRHRAINSGNSLVASL